MIYMKLKYLLLSIMPFLSAVSCSAGASPETVPVSALYIYGDAAEGLTQARKTAFSKMYDGSNKAVAGVFETYLNFSEGEFSVVDSEGNVWTLSEDGKVTKDCGESVFSGEKGVYRLRIDINAGRWSKVRVNSVTFRSFYGEKISLTGEYTGVGKWKFSGIPLDANTSEVKYYRFDVDSDNPQELAYLCSTKDLNTSDPESYKSAYQYVRTLGKSAFESIAGQNDGSAAAFRFASSDEGVTEITLSLNSGQSRYIHSVEIAPAGPPAAFMGDSITENWRKSSTGHPEFFTSNNYLNFGISGQTTTQMLARFEKEVVANKPQCVVICGGTNDIAGNGGAIENSAILKNIEEMGNMAQEARIKVILCSILPTDHYWWKPDMTPGEIVSRIAEMNTLIRNLCNNRNWTYVDYFTPMADKTSGAILSQYSDDRIHPNQAGYEVMEGIIRPVIRSVTGK